MKNCLKVILSLSMVVSASGCSMLEGLIVPSTSSSSPISRPDASTSSSSSNTSSVISTGTNYPLEYVAFGTVQGKYTEIEMQKYSSNV